MEQALDLSLDRLLNEMNNGTFDLNLKHLTDKQQQSVRFKDVKKMLTCLY